MNKTTTKLLCLGLIAGLPHAAHAVTTFTNGTLDFNTAGNWDNGLPDADMAVGGDNDTGVIAAGSTANTSASYGSGATAGEHFNLTVEGELNVGSGHTIHLGNGNGHNTGADLTVNGGVLNIDGTVTVIGSGADTFITNGGTINVRSGGLLDERKSLHLTNGLFNLAHDAASTASKIDHFNIGSGSTLHFDIVSTSLTTLFLQQDLDLTAGGSILDLTITGATAGDSYTLVSAAGTNGIDGEFGDFNYTINDGLIAELDYLSATNILTVNISAIPEPSSTALLGLGGLALLMRRKK